MDTKGDRLLYVAEEGCSSVSTRGDNGEAFRGIGGMQDMQGGFAYL